MPLLHFLENLDHHDEVYEHEDHFYHDDHEDHLHHEHHHGHEDHIHHEHGHMPRYFTNLKTSFAQVASVFGSANPPRISRERKISSSMECHSVSSSSGRPGTKNVVKPHKATAFFQDDDDIIIGKKNVYIKDKDGTYHKASPAESALLKREPIQIVPRNASTGSTGNEIPASSKYYGATGSSADATDDASKNDDTGVIDSDSAIADAFLGAISEVKDEFGDLIHRIPSIVKDIRDGQIFFSTDTTEGRDIDAEAHDLQLQVARWIGGGTIVGAFGLFTAFVYKLADRGRRKRKEQESRVIV